jgi:hypothetical protein
MSTMTVSAPSFTVRAAGAGATRVQPAGAGRATVRPAPVRLTRRGRLLVAVLALVLVVCAAVLLTGGASALAGTGQGTAPVAERVTVRPGETLWQIAERVAPGADPRETVQRILDLNGLQTAEVQAGTALRLP